MMYALFCWDQGQEKGGMNDFISAKFGTVNEAYEFYNANLLSTNYQIVNLRSMQVVKFGTKDASVAPTVRAPVL